MLPAIGVAAKNCVYWPPQLNKPLDSFNESFLLCSANCISLVNGKPVLTGLNSGGLRDGGPSMWGSEPLGIRTVYEAKSDPKGWGPFSAPLGALVSVLPGISA